MNNRIEVTKFMNDTLRLSDDQCAEVCFRLADVLLDDGCYCEGGIRSVAWLCDSCFEAVKVAPCEIFCGLPRVKETRDLLLFFNDETLDELGLSASSLDDEIDYSDCHKEGDECTCNETITLFVVNYEKFTSWAKAFLNGQNV